MGGPEVRVPIACDADVIAARQKGREMASELGFRSSDQVSIATAISEVARNMMDYASRGEIILSTSEKDGRKGICVIATDKGPGIKDLDLAMQDGYSTGKSLGLGLPGARRMMDEFAITSEVGAGTKVTMRKWEP